MTRGEGARSSDAVTTARGRRRRSVRPWHLWVVAALMLGLYVGGLRDHLLIQAGDTEYIRAQFGAGGLAYFADYPWGYRAVWTLNIVTGLAAPVALVFSAPTAYRLGLVALAAQVILFGATLLFRDRWDLLGPETGLADIVITLLTAVFVLYCRAVVRRERQGTEAR